MSLFSGSLIQGIERQEQSVISEILNIQNIPDNLEEIKKSLYEKYVINPIIFDENIEQKDVKQYEINQNIMATFGTIVNKEQRISIKYHITFTGDKELFFLGGSNVLLNYHLSIRNYKIEKNYIEIEHNWIDLAKDVNNQKKQIDSQNKQFLEYLQTNINYQKSDIQYFNNNLNNLIEKTLNQRTVELKKANDVFLAFGGKIEEKKPESIDQKTILNQNTKEQTEVKKEIKQVIKKELLHKEIAKKGGIKRHETTNIIKNEIIKKMFEKISGYSVNQKAMNINNKISEVISKNEFEKLAKQYDISIQLTREIKEYLKGEHFEQIYRWCLNLDKIKK
jgi:hypothetical protein